MNPPRILLIAIISVMPDISTVTREGGGGGGENGRCQPLWLDCVCSMLFASLRGGLLRDEPLGPQVTTEYRHLTMG